MSSALFLYKKYNRFDALKNIYIFKSFRICSKFNFENKIEIEYPKKSIRTDEIVKCGGSRGVENMSQGGTLNNPLS